MVEGLLDRFKQHQREEAGDRRLRDIRWDITEMTRACGSDKQ